MTNQEFYWNLTVCKMQNQSEEKAAMLIMTYVYTNPGKFNLHRIDEDKRSDFLLWMYPRFRLIYRRADRERNIISYLQSCISWTFKSWLKKEYSEEAYQLAIQQCMYLEDGDISEHSDTAMEEEPEYQGIGKNIKPRQILILALKSCIFINDHHVLRLSSYTGYTIKQIYACLDALEPEIQRRKELLIYNAGIRNIYYVKCSRYIYELSKLEKGSSRYILLYRQYIHSMQKWTKSAEKMKKLFLSPSNQKIADVLHIKRSAVESSLKYLKKHSLQAGFFENNDISSV